ncbi:hypothetical protein EX30DRAFT_104339 [Ascodesmis nigricans]|uniref:Magnesium chelatase n=1 Tax=Ascodesmis nigricans TaxID=341454 RepID=A0A4S2N4Y4_9PEZI|nr:hypothetical protein EX30DRAFT_104339 [Ascodesmis nigricans]
MGISVGRTVLPEMLVVTGLEDAKTEVQGFIAEVMRNRRVELQNGGWIRSGDLFTVVEVAPKTLREHKGISRHLADFFFISYHYTPITEDVDDDGSSFASVVIRKSPSSVSDIQLPSIDPDTIALFRNHAEKVNISTEIKRYMHDLIACIRMHRAVRSGCVWSRATQDFEVLVRCLAVIHGLDFVTPALVTLAISKIYNHRLEIIQRPKLERSVLYGSGTGTVGQYLERITPEMVVDDAVKSVRVPL